MTTTAVELALKPYGPPYRSERAWSGVDGDSWMADALRDCFVMALVAGLQKDVRDPELRKFAHPDREVTHFRSHRFGRNLRSLDGDIVDRVMAMPIGEIEEVAVWRRDNAEYLNGHPRAVLDDFAQDIEDNVFEAGLWDKAMSERWAAHDRAVAAPVEYWLQRFQGAREAAQETTVTPAVDGQR